MIVHALQLRVSIRHTCIQQQLVKVCDRVSRLLVQVFQVTQSDLVIILKIVNDQLCCRRRVLNIQLTEKSIGFSCPHFDRGGVHDCFNRDRLIINLCHLRRDGFQLSLHLIRRGSHLVLNDIARVVTDCLILDMQRIHRREDFRGRRINIDLCPLIDLIKSSPHITQRLHRFAGTVELHQRVNHLGDKTIGLNEMTPLLVKLGARQPHSFTGCLKGGLHVLPGGVHVTVCGSDVTQGLIKALQRFVELLRVRVGDIQLALVIEHGGADTRVRVSETTVRDFLSHLVDLLSGRDLRIFSRGRQQAHCLHGGFQGRHLLIRARGRIGQHINARCCLRRRRVQLSGGFN